MLRELLAEERTRLIRDEALYQEIIHCGVGALSGYDREVAYGGDWAFARAASLAMKLAHIANARGRIAWIGTHLDRNHQLMLFSESQ